MLSSALFLAQVTSHTFSIDDKTSTPDFIVVDVSSDHANLPGSADDNVPVLLSAIKSASSLSWIHVLSYNVLLLRYTCGKVLV